MEELIEPLEIIKSKVVGVSQQNEDGTYRQDLLKSCRTGDVLLTIRDPKNPYDNNAIEVWTESGKQIGFINKELAEDLAPILDDGGYVICKIKEITGGPQNDKDSFGCNIFIEIYSYTGDMNYVIEKYPKTNNYHVTNMKTKNAGCAGLAIILITVSIIAKFFF